jgi:hypothetical protein
MSKNIHQMSNEIKNHELDLAKRESGFLGRSIRKGGGGVQLCGSKGTRAL